MGLQLRRELPLKGFLDCLFLGHLFLGHLFLGHFLGGLNRLFCDLFLHLHTAPPLCLVALLLLLPSIMCTPIIKKQEFVCILVKLLECLTVVH